MAKEYDDEVMGKGINRYIMECKFLFTSLFVYILFELIDTLWNVNICFIAFVGSVLSN